MRLSPGPPDEYSIIGPGTNYRVFEQRLKPVNTHMVQFAERISLTAQIAQLVVHHRAKKKPQALPHVESSKVDTWPKWSPIYLSSPVFDAC